mgnify:CR=1 FL=1
MKKLLLAACVAALGVSACSSGNTNTKTADGTNYSASDAKYQIIDQEFDNMLAPEADYDSIPAYELQACGDSYLPPATTALKGTTKPAAKKTTTKKTSSTSAKSSSTDVTKTKKVINNTNIYYLNSDTPAPASTTTTTTYSSEEALPDTL